MRSLRTLALIAGAIWTLLPLAPILVWSVSTSWRWPSLAPQQWSLRAWDDLLSPATRAAPALATSAAIGLAVMGLSLALGAPAALALARGRVAGRTLVEALLLAPLLVPPLAVGMGVQVLLIRLGLADTVAGVVLAHLVFSLPYVVLILTDSFAALDPVWEQQAQLLGAARWRVAWSIMLPLVQPGIVVSGLLAFLVSWSQYPLTLLVGGGRVFTLPLLVVATSRGGDTPLLAASTVLFVAPTLAALLLAGRHVGAGPSGAGLR